MTVTASGKRVLAVALLALPLIVVAAIAAGYFYGSWSVAAAMRDIDVAMRQASREIRELDEIQQSTDGLDRRYEEVIHAAHDTPMLAAASLSIRLNALLERAGGRRSLSQILEITEHPPFGRAAVRLRASFDAASLRDFLYAVETEPLLLTVRELALRPIHPNNLYGLIQAEMTIVGHVLHETDEGTDSPVAAKRAAP